MDFHFSESMGPVFRFEEFQLKLKSIVIINLNRLYLNLYASIVKDIQISLCIYAVKAVWPWAYASMQPNQDTTLFLAKPLFFSRDLIIDLRAAVRGHLAEILPSDCPRSAGF